MNVFWTRSVPARMWIKNHWPFRPTMEVKRRMNEEEEEDRSVIGSDQDANVCGIWRRQHAWVDAQPCASRGILFPYLISVCLHGTLLPSSGRRPFLQRLWGEVWAGVLDNRSQRHCRRFYWRSWTDKERWIRYSMQSWGERRGDAEGPASYFSPPKLAPVSPLSQRQRRQELLWWYLTRSGWYWGWDCTRNVRF